MELSTALETRRSIRAYEAGKTLDEATIEALIYAAQQAPSWKNSETGRYYVINTPEKVESAIASCLPAFNQERSKNAAALIVTAFEKGQSGHGPEGQPTDELADGWGAYDLGLQNANLMLKAAELGLGTLVMGLRDIAKLRELLNIPDSQILGPVIAIGAPAESPAKPVRLEQEEILHIF